MVVGDQVFRILIQGAYEEPAANGGDAAVGIGDERAVRPPHGAVDPGYALLGVNIGEILFRTAA